MQKVQIQIWFQNNDNENTNVDTTINVNENTNDDTDANNQIDNKYTTVYDASTQTYKVYSTAELTKSGSAKTESENEKLIIKI